MCENVCEGAEGELLALCIETGQGWSGLQYCFAWFPSAGVWRVESQTGRDEQRKCLGQTMFAGIEQAGMASMAPRNAHDKAEITAGVFHLKPGDSEGRDRSLLPWVSMRPSVFRHPVSTPARHRAPNRAPPSRVPDRKKLSDCCWNDGHGPWWCLVGGSGAIQPAMEACSTMFDARAWNNTISRTLLERANLTDQGRR